MILHKKGGQSKPKRDFPAEQTVEREVNGVDAHLERGGQDSE